MKFSAIIPKSSAHMRRYIARGVILFLLLSIAVVPFFLQRGGGDGISSNSFGQHTPQASTETSQLTAGGLAASYFSNTDLAGEPVLKRIDGPLDQRWSANKGPAGELRAPLSVRWEGFLIAEATADYTLITTGDDGVRLWLDGQKLIDKWVIRSSSADQVVVELEAERPYPIVIEFFDRGYLGEFRFEWQSDQIERQLVPASALATGEIAPPAPAGEPGLQARYFANQNLQGEPVLIQVEPLIDRSWGRSGGPTATMRAPLSIQWRGSLIPPADGLYTLITTSDDGIRVWLDGKKLIDRWVVRYASEDQATVDLKANRAYPLVIEFFDRGYNGTVRLEWQSNTIPRQVVPTSALRAQGSGPRAEGQWITLNTAAPTDVDQVNPMRGFYRWLGQENIPSPEVLPEPSLDSYRRYEWITLEPARGEYDFSAIERDIARAAERGLRHGIRVRALTSDDRQAVPDYLVDLLEKGWRHDYNGDGRKIYVPDWNDPDFLSRAEQLLQALGERYNDDPRVGFIDIGIFGVWGEWHTHRLPYPSPSGATNMTTSNRQRLIDMHLAAFPDKYLVMMTDDERSLIYALRQSPHVGWRRDSLGDQHFNRVLKDVASLGEAELELFTQRWKTAPVITEFMNPSRQIIPQSYHTARDQVQNLHVSMVGNGNTRSWKDLTPTEREALLEIGQLSGYHYALQTVALPSTARVGEALTIESSWVNLGVAPAYDHWQVFWQLRDSRGQVVWEQASGLNLRTLLPAEASAPNSGGADADQAPADGAERAELAAPYTQIDRLSIASGLAPGTYKLAVQVRDPQGYLRPMQLAVETPYQNGSYTLGQLVIAR
jgi:hypothetical protein